MRAPLPIFRSILEFTGDLTILPDAQAAQYDSDGNTTRMNGEWVYRWNGENRLVEAETVVPQFRLRFAYDWRGRRVRKQVWEWDALAGAYPAQPTEDLLFVYDDWNLVAELDATAPGGTPRPLRTHLWGQDLSGTLQGAGGVGGLIATTHHTYDPAPATSTYFVAYDGNGNVMGLVDAQDGAVAAEYDYDPWGQFSLITNTLSVKNPITCSSRYFDFRIKTINYGVRYYHAFLLRWLRRDPAALKGGANQYCYLYNSPKLYFENLGETPITIGSATFSVPSALMNAIEDETLQGYLPHRNYGDWKWLRLSNDQCFKDCAVVDVLEGLTSSGTWAACKQQFMRQAVTRDYPVSSPDIKEKLFAHVSNSYDDRMASSGIGQSKCKYVDRSIWADFYSRVLAKSDATCPSGRRLYIQFRYTLKINSPAACYPSDDESQKFSGVNLDVSIEYKTIINPSQCDPH